MLIAHAGVLRRTRPVRRVLAHQADVAAIASGRAVLGVPLGVTQNGAWFVVAGMCWLRGR